MSYHVDGELRFRPVRLNDFRPRENIGAGATGDTPSTPFQTGIGTLAYNQLTTWAQAGHLVIADRHHDTVVIASSGTDYDIAAYKFPTPNFLGASGGRRYLKVSVKGKVSAGTWTIKGRTSVGSATTATTGGTSLSTIDDLYVPINYGSQEEYLILTIRGDTNGATFTFEGITGTIKKVTSITGGSDIYQADRMHPLDTTAQMVADMPFTVDDARSLIKANDLQFRWNIRPVAHYCAIARYGTLWTSSNDPIAGVSQHGRYLTPGGGDDAMYQQWLYFPRQGVNHLRVALDAYMPGWMSTADNGKLYLGFADTPDRELITVNKGSYFGSSTWFNAVIKVPSGQVGPLRLEMGALGDTVRVPAVSIYEVGGGEQ